MKTKFKVIIFILILGVVSSCFTLSAYAAVPLDIFIRTEDGSSMGYYTAYNDVYIEFAYCVSYVYNDITYDGSYIIITDMVTKESTFIQGAIGSQGFSFTDGSTYPYHYNTSHGEDWYIWYYGIKLPSYIYQYYLGDYSSTNYNEVLDREENAGKCVYGDRYIDYDTEKYYGSIYIYQVPFYESKLYFTDYDGSIIESVDLYPGTVDISFSESTDGLSMLVSNVDTSFSHTIHILGDFSNYIGYVPSQDKLSYFSDDGSCIPFDTSFSYVNSKFDVSAYKDTPFGYPDWFGWNDIYICLVSSTYEDDNIVGDSIDINNSIDSNISDLDKKEEHFQDVMKDYNSLNKPTFSKDVIQIDEQQTQDVIAYSATFNSVFDNKLILGMLMTCLTFVFVGYVLFGKKA